MRLLQNKILFVEDTLFPATLSVYLNRSKQFAMKGTTPTEKSLHSNYVAEGVRDYEWNMRVNRRGI